MPVRKEKLKIDFLLELCVSSLRRGHANLLCIVPSLMDASKASPEAACDLALYVPITSRDGAPQVWTRARLARARPPTPLPL